MPLNGPVPSINRFAGALGLLLLALILAVTASAPASAIENLRRYAGIVVDGKTGEVMYEDNADSRRYPASLSKVMTLYIAFEELAAGNITLDTEITVSRHAANAVPTKLGLRAGAKITFRDAMRSLVTLSANDMARAIGEHISGSEEEFGHRMTATARALGMRSTTYRNASGLPDGAQITTVRDQAILAMAIYQHFPERYELFQTTSFRYGGRTYGNHNRVLGYLGAVDGIKTGFIRASGSNLMTAARKDDKHIIVIAFGFASGAARDEKVRELVRTYLPRARAGSYLEASVIPRPGSQSEAPILFAAARPVYVEPLPTPAFRVAEIEAGGTSQIVTASLGARLGVPTNGNSAVEATAALASLGGAVGDMPQVAGAWIGENYSLSAVPDDHPTVAALPAIPTIGWTGGRDADPVVTGSVPASGNPAGAWQIQVGVAPDLDAANDLVGATSDTIASADAARPRIESFERHGLVQYRVRFTGFADRDEAQAACRAIAASCLVVSAEATASS